MPNDLITPRFGGGVKNNNQIWKMLFFVSYWFIAVVLKSASTREKKWKMPFLFRKVLEVSSLAGIVIKMNLIETDMALYGVSKMGIVTTVTFY